jgi:protein gp37
MGFFVYVSLAPLLERIVLPDDFLRLAKWVIVNGECEQIELRRTMQADWARAIRDQCRAASIPFFMRGMHRGAAVPSDLLYWEFPSV